MPRKPSRVVYGTRLPTPKQLASHLSAQCRRVLGASKSEPWNESVEDGDIIVHEPTGYPANTPIGGHYAWEHSFEMPVHVYAFGIYAYEVDPRRGGELIAWAGSVVVLPDLDVEIVDVFKKVPAHIVGCIARGAR